ncbi:unnamed protein product [Brassica oleracea var. botrytis]
MSLQYPLLFPYGEYGFHPEIPLHLETGTSRTRQFLTIRQYYASQIQTRLPHAHILLWLGNSSRTPSAEEVDEIISAELPDKEKDPAAYDLVTKHMILGPCGLINPKSPCMENNVCTKKYPRPYNDNTSIDKSGYVLYRRRRNDDASTVKAGQY